MAMVAVGSMSCPIVDLRLYWGLCCCAGCESWTIRRLSTQESMLSNYGAGEDS